MEDTILAKLREKVARPPENEADVVYVLVEIRKYLDHTDPDRNNFKILRTYCDWVAHIFLDRGGVKSLLVELDAALAAGGNETEQKRAMKTRHDHFSLSKFQDELRRFLASNALPVLVVDDQAHWGQFLKHYVAVVSDCPFISGSTPTNTKAIRRATLEINPGTKSMERSQEGMVNVIWLWKLELADGTTRIFSSTYGYSLK
jgi:hypothetical protein